MGRFGDLSLGDLTPEIVRSICIDFIVNERSSVEIQRKFNISESAFYAIRDRLDLIKRRDKYRTKVLDKALSKLANKQSVMLVKAVKILSKHMEKIDGFQKISGDMPLPSKLVQDVMNIYSIFQKEKRLDEDKPTDNLGVNVKVQFDDSIPILGETVYEEAQIVEIKKDSEEEKLNREIESKVQETADKEVKVIIDEETIGGVL